MSLRTRVDVVGGRKLPPRFCQQKPVVVQIIVRVGYYNGENVFEVSLWLGNLAIHCEPSRADTHAFSRAPPDDERAGCDQHRKLFFAFGIRAVIVDMLL